MNVYTATPKDLEAEEGIRRVLEFFPPDRVYVISDCGLRTRTWDKSKAKLQVMVDAGRSMKRELGI